MMIKTDYKSEHLASQIGDEEMWDILEDVSKWVTTDVNTNSFSSRKTLHNVCVYVWIIVFSRTRTTKTDKSSFCLHSCKFPRSHFTSPSAAIYSIEILFYCYSNIRIRMMSILIRPVFSSHANFRKQDFSSVDKKEIFLFPVVVGGEKYSD